jgi:hypothetical protein
MLGAPDGGSARGYQQLFVLLSLPTLAGQPCGQDVYLCSFALGASARVECVRRKLRARSLLRRATGLVGTRSAGSRGCHHRCRPCWVNGRPAGEQRCVPCRAGRPGGAVGAGGQPASAAAQHDPAGPARAHPAAQAGDQGVHRPADRGAAAADPAGHWRAHRRYASGRPRRPGRRLRAAAAYRRDHGPAGRARSGAAGLPVLGRHLRRRQRGGSGPAPGGPRPDAGLPGHAGREQELAAGRRGRGGRPARRPGRWYGAAPASVTPGRGPGCPARTRPRVPGSGCAGSGRCRARCRPWSLLRRRART